MSRNHLDKITNRLPGCCEFRELPFGSIGNALYESFVFVLIFGIVFQPVQHLPEFFFDREAAKLWSPSVVFICLDRCQNQVWKLFIGQGSIF